MEKGTIEVKRNVRKEKTFEAKNGNIDISSGSTTTKYSVDYEIIKDVQSRIKIYNKDKTPEQFLSIRIPIHISGHSKEKLVSLKAYTYNLVNGKVEKMKIKSADVFTEKKSDYIEYKIFTFPNVKDGSILEYKYTISSPFFWEADTWYFQKEIPVLHSEFTFTAPELLIYNKDLRGGLYGTSKESSFDNVQDDFGAKSYEYVYKKVPALKDEPFVFNPKNMMASVRHELMQYYNKYNGETQNFSTTWGEIAKELSQDSKLYGQLKQNNFLADETQQIINGKNTESEKLIEIFNHVKNNFTWEKYLSIYAKKGIKKTFKDKQGTNSADLNLLLVAMLREAKIEAYPVVLSTVNNGFINYTNASLTQLNHLICSAVINGSTYLMDATEKNSRIGQLPQRDLNQRGFQIKDNGTFKEIPLINTIISEDKQSISIQLTQDGSVKGKYSEVITNYYSMLANDFKTHNEEGFHNQIKSQFPDVEIENYKVKSTKSGDKMKISFEFNAEEMTDVLNEKVIINPMFLVAKESNPFKAENRNYPLEFGTPSKKTKIVIINIPQGYTVEFIPKKFEKVLPNDAVGFAYDVKQKDGQLVISSVFQCNYSSLSPEYYNELKSLYNQIIEQENQEIILTKV